MASNADYKLRLKTELSEVSSEIGKLIESDQVSAETKQGYDELETALLLLMYVDEVLYLIWIAYLMQLKNETQSNNNDQAGLYESTSMQHLKPA